MKKLSPHFLSALAIMIIVVITHKVLPQGPLLFING